MTTVDYFMSHGSPWSFLGHNQFIQIAKNYNVQVNMYPVNYGEIFPISGGLPVSKRPPQRQNIRLQELQRWSKFLKINLNAEPTYFPSKSMLPSLIIIASQIKKTNKDFEIANKIMNALWVEDLDIDDEYVLKSILEKMGLNSEDILLCANGEECLNNMQEYTKLAIQKGVFGAPTYIIDDQIYWGQDRLDFVEMHLASLI
ncbi:2-hydroxychromene-2-carboxylate isomerase [Alphaproteobacteria bacterium]|jgi:2-hydroxychromene-2-carboxylate isomerase|nr:2-hydroxychromene-2-carboxylate isomerase [Alphaproteobacteria bacterium]MDC1133756.1 2-hydroxychromene-2-carboxylate isomerase [Alphaproteobacteria bacterium]|tara:strand:+ start:5350 stop:5952 length:603 start_codon:yes stop_codon:yes gene_type:complete